jgi:hypothetical protein
VVVGRRDAVRAEPRRFKKRGETTFAGHQVREAIMLTLQNHIIIYRTDLFERR